MNVTFASCHRSALLLAGLAALVMVASFVPAALPALRYDREAVLHGEVWRLLSAHVVHTNLAHALLNLLGLLLLAATFARDYSGSQWLWLLTCCALLTSAGLMLFSPAVQWYCGLSGVLHGAALAIFADRAFAANDSASSRSWHLLALILLLAKIAWDLVYGGAPSSAQLIGAPIVVVAHGYGGAAGALFIWLLRRQRQRTQSVDIDNLRLGSAPGE